MLNNVANDLNFEPEIDDPKYNKYDKNHHYSKPNSLLAFPIISRQNSGNLIFRVPKGVIIALNKINGLDFNQEDINNLKMYTSISSFLIEINGKLEFLNSISDFSKFLDGSVGRVENSMEYTTLTLQVASGVITDLKEKLKIFNENKH